LKINDTHRYVLSRIKVDVAFHDLEQKLKTSGNNPQILKIAKKSLNKARRLWKPKAVFRLFNFENTGRNNVGCVIQNSGSHVDLDFGHSFQFLTHARQAFISVYTAGPELEQEAKNASSKGDLLEAYFLNIISLIVLDQTEQTIKEMARKHAENLGWGVSPFLSPGSVHGWDLKEQIKVCSVLPLEKINVKIREDVVLFPFNTISCLIGMGPGYDAVQVGTTCQVCSKNYDCQMKQN